MKTYASLVALLGSFSSVAAFFVPPAPRFLTPRLAAAGTDAFLSTGDENSVGVICGDGLTVTVNATTICKGMSRLSDTSSARFGGSSRTLQAALNIYQHEGYNRFGDFSLARRKAGYSSTVSIIQVGS